MPHRWTDAPFVGNKTERRHWRSSYLLANAFEVWVAVAAITSSVATFLAPAASKTSISKVGPWDGNVWSVMYFAGAVLMLWGLSKPDPRSEIAGLSLLGCATAMNALAIVAVNGTVGVPSMLTYLGIAAAALCRAWLVLRLMRVGGERRHEG
jgi:hypothetical protein